MSTRLLTAPFLHANLAHILFNGTALLLAGWVLERLVGRVWFLAVFVTGASGGSLMSLAINPGNLTSVGASGAVMALFAAMLVLSFRLPSGPLRTRAQVGSTRILIPSLLPLATTTAGAMQIDYGAHFGGALAGAGLGLLLLRTWPAASRILHQVPPNGTRHSRLSAFCSLGWEVRRLQCVTLPIYHRWR